MMGFIEKVKGFFKSKPTFDQFAMVIVSDVRQAIIMELGLMYERRVGYDFKQIIYGVSDRLNRQVSRGSLTSHLKKLDVNGIITAKLDEGPVPDFEQTIWKLTPRGRVVFKALEKVEKEMEEENK